MGPGGPRAHARHHLSRISSDPAVSVVTIAWRNEQHAAAFAESVAGDQLIVVINGPEGEAAAALIPDAEVVRLEENTGFSGGPTPAWPGSPATSS